MADRISKAIYYLEMARTASMRSTCLKNHVGVVIVKNDEIISTGYNGAPRGRKNCIDIGQCYRIKNNIPSGVQYEACRSLHGEMNAIISASRDKMLNAAMYIFQWDALDNCIRRNAGCCKMCQRMIINAGIDEVYFADPDGFAKTKISDDIEYGYRVQRVQEWVDSESDNPIG